jgi:hypothetical protein
MLPTASVTIPLGGADSPEQASHFHIMMSVFRASPLTWRSAGYRVRKSVLNFTHELKKNWLCPASQTCYHKANLAGVMECNHNNNVWISDMSVSIGMGAVLLMKAVSHLLHRNCLIIRIKRLIKPATMRISINPWCLQPWFTCPHTQGLEYLFHPYNCHRNLPLEG